MCGNLRPDSLLSLLPGYRSDRPPRAAPRPDCLMTTPLSLRIFPITGKRRHKQAALVVAIAASCVVSSILISVLSAQTQLGPVRKLSNRLVIESDIDLQPNF